MKTGQFSEFARDLALDRGTIDNHAHRRVRQSFESDRCAATTTRPGNIDAGPAARTSPRNRGWGASARAQAETSHSNIRALHTQRVGRREGNVIPAALRVHTYDEGALPVVLRRCARRGGRWQKRASGTGVIATRRGVAASAARVGARDGRRGLGGTPPCSPQMTPRLPSGSRQHATGTAISVPNSPLSSAGRTK